MPHIVLYNKNMKLTIEEKKKTAQFNSEAQTEQNMKFGAGADYLYGQKVRKTCNSNRLLM